MGQINAQLPVTFYNYINNQMLSSTLETNGNERSGNIRVVQLIFYNTAGRLDSLLVEDQ